MYGFISPVLNCIQCVYGETKFIPCAYWNKKKLKKEMGRLDGMRRDVTTIINNQKQMQPGTECKVVVRRWLDDVNDKETEVNGLLDSIQRRNGCTCCLAAGNGIKLLELIDDVHVLVVERKTFDDKELVEPIPVDHRQTYKENLRKKMEELIKMQEDVQEIIRRQERENPGKECKVVVRRWLDDVRHKEEEVNVILHSFVESSSWVEKVKDLTVSIQSLVEERKKFDDRELVEAIPVDPTGNVPDLATPMVGRNLELLEIHGYIKDSKVKTVGIWGPGGIGKTTLLKSIKDELRSTNHEFFYIVWIEMSSQNTVDILHIQNEIATSISLTLPSKDYKAERARILRNVLLHKKSLILIDNLSNKLEFEEIGIPFGVDIDNVKIVLTARSERVCTNSRADKIVKLDYLSDADSRQLFQNNIRPTLDLTNNKIVRQYVDEILKRCGGLPLVIITVARTVADYTDVDVEQWDDAVDCLQNSPTEIEGMDDVMKRLKFSYDKLQNDEIRSCLLYFSLYPEGWDMRVDEIIQYWIGEGFLNVPDNNSFKKSYARGLSYYNKLMSTCLLEKSGISDYVMKVHDMIRHMLRLISKNEKREVLLVYSKQDDVVSNGYKDWNLAKGIFLNVHQLQYLPQEGMPTCDNLTSLILQTLYCSCPVIKLPTEDFFHFTPSLRVLDMSYTRLEDIPKSIGELVELRHLNLHRTRIKMLPMELGNLKKLTSLDLGDAFFLQSIPNVAISQLSQLQWLNLHNSGYQWDPDMINGTEHRSLSLEDLRELKNLEELGVDVLSISHLNTILSSKILLKAIARIRFLHVDFTAEEGQPIKLISERFPPLRILIVEHCALPGNILEIKVDHQLVIHDLYLRKLEISSVITVKDCPFHSLVFLDIYVCRRLKEVSWAAHMPSLQQLNLVDCDSIEELVATGEEETEEERECYFPKLRNLTILGLKNLQRIHGRSRLLLFPALKIIYINKCPELKELCLGRHSAGDMELIDCEQSQWDSLKWEDEEVKSKFVPFFRATTTNNNIYSLYSYNSY